MKKLGLIICIVCVAFLFYFKKNNTSIITSTTPTRLPPQTIPTTTVKKEYPKNNNYFVFVPYWSSISNNSPFFPDINNAPPHVGQGIIYFGITANENGINMREQGFKNLGLFVQKTITSKFKKILTLRLINDTVTEKVLQNVNLQKNIIGDTIAIAKKNGFDEILLDLEVHDLPTEKIIHDISNFIQKNSAQAHVNNLRFSVSLYGDVFYRKRPYDVSSISKVTDMMYLMAYDFHKSHGEPGPNFPLSGKEVYGYDLKSMVNDFLHLVPSEKLTVVFGMYGYDWILDGGGRPLKAAEALTLRSINTNFISACKFTGCRSTHDVQSTETNIKYLDENSFSHSIWFDNEQSVAEKMSYLHSKKINSYAFWAYSYY